jgi:RNA polymerase sigma-70 factor (ECF subfamily)
MRSAAGTMSESGWLTKAPRAGRGPAAARAEADQAALRRLRERSDSELVTAFQAGASEAFDVIVERHQRQVYALCFRFVRNHEEAADLAQDAFVRAFKGLERFKGDASLGTWLYRIAVNVCLNRAAVKRPQIASLDDAAGLDANAVDPLRELLKSERAAAVQAAIDRLPPKQRATLMLRVYQECSHKEIAEALDSTVGAVKANFFHALGNLRRMLSSS